MVGGVISGVMAGISSYKATGKVDWGSVAINAASGAASGLVAATGLGPLVQGGISAAISGVTSVAEQWHSKGFNNIDMKEVALSAGNGGLTSLVGSAVGFVVSFKPKKLGTQAIKAGRNKLMTSVSRRGVGQSHSAYRRQGYKLMAKGKKYLNTARGISSTIGSVSGIGTSYAYNKFIYRRLQ